RSRFTICVDDDASGPRTGPKMPAGLMTENSSAPPSALTKSHAARSAISFDLTYALMSPRSGFDQFVSSNGSARGGSPYETGPHDEVMTTRFTFASRAARRTRSEPSRAEAITSASVCRAESDNGEATWITQSQPAVASGQPESLVRSALKTVRRSASAPAVRSI